MTVTEHLMRPGTFSVGLRRTLPTGVAKQILEALEGAGAHIVITPGPLPEGTSDATRLGSALYTGRIEERPSRGSIEGKGIAAWLGNDDGTTVIETAITKTASSLTTWITDLLVNGITVGTITNTTTYAGTFQYVTYREAIDQVCLAVGAEYELRPNFTINAAAPATLFGNPTVVVTRKPEGVDGQYRGIEGGLLDQSVTASRQARKIVVIGQGGATGSATNGSLALKDKAGNAPTLTRLVDAASEPSGNLAGLATATLNLSGVRREFNVSSTSPGVRNHVRPGSYVYVYDVDSGIVDTANQIVFRGEVISPLKVRVLSLSWPIERGMGVYLRSNAATPQYTDLSDYVEFDSGDAFWTVGSERVSQASGAPARLGANPDIAARVGDTELQTWTPVVQQGIGVAITINYAMTQRIGNKIECWFHVTATAGGSAGSAIQIGGLPVNVAFASFNIVGIGHWVDVSAGNLVLPAHLVIPSATNVVRFWTSTIDSTTPQLGTLAIASGDVLSGHFSYEAA